MLRASATTCPISFMCSTEQSVRSMLLARTSARLASSRVRSVRLAVHAATSLRCCCCVLAACPCCTQDRPINGRTPAAIARTPAAISTDFLFMQPRHLGTRPIPPAYRKAGQSRGAAWVRIVRPNCEPERFPFARTAAQHRRHRPAGASGVCVLYFPLVGASIGSATAPSTLSAWQQNGPGSRLPGPSVSSVDRISRFRSG